MLAVGNPERAFRRALRDRKSSRFLDSRVDVWITHTEASALKLSDTVPTTHRGRDLPK